MMKFYNQDLHLWKLFYRASDRMPWPTHARAMDENGLVVRSHRVIMDVNHENEALHDVLWLRTSVLVLPLCQELIIKAAQFFDNCTYGSFSIVPNTNQMQLRCKWVEGRVVPRMAVYRGKVRTWGNDNSFQNAEDYNRRTTFV